MSESFTSSFFLKQELELFFFIKSEKGFVVKSEPMKNARFKEIVRVYCGKISKSKNRIKSII
jgi:hypothetical protein